MGQLVVASQPGALRPALFAQPAICPVYARFSNGSGARQHDGVADVRGVAIKLLGVPGKKLIPGLEDKRTQDFLFIQVPATPFRDPSEFVFFVRIATKGKALLVPKLIGAFGLGRALSILGGLASMPKVSSMATDSRLRRGSPPIAPHINASALRASNVCWGSALPMMTFAVAAPPAPRAAAALIASRE